MTRKMSSLMMIAILAGGVSAAPGQFKNKPQNMQMGAKPAAMAKQSAASFTLDEAALVTAIKAPQAAEGDVETTVKVLRDGQVVYTSESVPNWPGAVVVNPYLVFPPGVYTVELADGSRWWRDPATGSGRIDITKSPVTSLPAGGALNAHLPAAGVNPFSISDALAGARIDPSDLKQNLDGKTAGFKTTVESANATQGKKLGLGQQQGGMSQTGGGSSVSSGRKDAFAGMEGQGMAPSKYGDTYAGQRWNDGRTGSPDNFSGAGKGHASSGDDGDVYGAIVQMLTDAGGTVTGDPQTDAAEAAYMMSVGSDGWEATKNMSTDERQSYWENEQNRQMLGLGRPREDDQVTGGFVVFGNANMRRSMVQFQAKAIAARRGGAGAPEAQAGNSSGVKLPMGQDGRPLPEQNNSTINWDAIFQINELVNPTRQ